MALDNRPALLRFGSFDLDVRTGELRKNDQRIRLQDQPAKLLALLASRPGELVTRTDIQKALWGEDRFVEFEHAINTAIKKIREALEDDHGEPKIIETLPRKGYRFIAAVEEVRDQVPEQNRAPARQAGRRAFRSSAAADHFPAIVRIDPGGISGDLLYRALL